MNFVLLYLAILPSVILGFYIYKKDVVEKEPVSLLLRSFLSGVASGIIVIVISAILDVSNYSLDAPHKILFYSFVLISLIEEGTKFIITYLMCYRSKEFNYRYDGIVYASFVSLGFATLENLLYVFEIGNIQTALYRGFLTVPAHVFFAIFMGYYLAEAKHFRRYRSPKKERKNLLMALIIPTIMHGFFNYCLFTGSIIGLIFFLIFIFALYITCFKRVKEVSEKRQHI